jgi:hypothetical protein
MVEQPYAVVNKAIIIYPGKALLMDAQPGKVKVSSLHLQDGLQAVRIRFDFNLKDQ